MFKRKPHIYPLTEQEINDRLWDENDLRCLCASGRLLAVKPQCYTAGKTYYFETWQDRQRYHGLRTRRNREYEQEERIIADMCGTNYPGDGIDLKREPNLAFFDYIEDPKPAVQTAAAQQQSDGWKTFCGVMKCIWFVLELLMLPFTILGMRDTTQWWYGTGKYAKGRDEEW